MTAPRGRHPLTGWPADAADALGPALDAAAETVAAETRQALARIGVGGDRGAAVVAGRDGDGRSTVTVTMPGAAALEFGTLRTAARPFLRPAAAALRDDIRRRLAAAVRHALPPRDAR